MALNAGSGGDAQVLQQSSKPASEDRRFSPEGLHLVSISVHLLGFDIARGRVLFVGLVFCVLVPRLLLLLSQRVLSRWALRNHQLYLELFW
jgi:phage FluMu protein gp41